MPASRRLAVVRLLTVAGAISLLAACSVPTGPGARPDELPARAEPANVAPASDEAPDSSATSRSGYGVGHG